MVSVNKGVEPTLIFEISMPSVSLLFSGLMLPQLAPSHRD